MRRALLAALLIVAGGPMAAGAQDWQTLTVARQLRDTAEVHVHVEYGDGRFALRAAARPVLYAMDLRYDQHRGTPLHAYDPSAHTLDIGLKGVNVGWNQHGSSDDNQARMQLSLAPSVPMDLSLALGATQATIDLGGMTVRGLHVESGAADETLDFSTPNRAQLGAVTIDVGAASFGARNLANARAASLHVDGGVGDIDLGFGGTWTRNLDASIHVTLGRVTLHVPDDVGVQLDVQRLAASFDEGGLVKRDGSYYSENWSSAKYHLRVHVETTFGRVAFERSGSSAQP